MGFLRSNSTTLFLISGLLLTSSAIARPPVELQQLRQQVPNAVNASLLVGHVDPTSTVHFTVSLPYADPDGMQRFADSVSNPSSPNYRHFITPDQVGQRFGPSLSGLNSVVSYLKSNGVQIDLVSRNRLGILAHSTSAQAEATFHTNLNQYRLNDGSARNGEIYRSFATPLGVPASLGALVKNVSGLETYTKPKPLVGLSPTMTRTLYSTAAFYAAGNEGENRTIGISSFGGFQTSYAVTFISTFNLPTPAAGPLSNMTIESIDGGAQNSGQNIPEADLDIQLSLGVAPLCNLIVYDGGDGDLIGVLTQEASEDKADVITESYGWKQLGNTAEESAHDQHLSMSAEGITYMVASGDTGTDNQGYTYPDCDPEATIVGGTYATTDSNGNRQSEVGWNNDGGAGGGGWNSDSSTFNVLPSWQKGTGVPTSINARLYPDVALNASPEDGYFFFSDPDGQYAEYYGGGTSAASPTFAASLALTQQYLISQGALPADANGHYRFGRINDLLYAIGDADSIFYDITSGTNGTLPNGQTSEAGVGWDFVSGWGAMNFANLATFLKGVPAVSSVNFSPSTVAGGSGSTGTVTLSSAAANGAIVELVSSSSSAVVPERVFVNAGNKTATFSVTTSAVTTTTVATISGSTAGGHASGTLTVTAPGGGGGGLTLTLSASSVTGGYTVTGTVTLPAAAPTGGAKVTLSSNNTNAASVPPSVTVAAGANSATFTVNAHAVSTSVGVTISATYGGNTATAKVNVLRAELKSVQLGVGTCIGGVTTQQVKFTLTGTAPTGGSVVTISSSNAAVASFSSSSVTVPAGSVSVTVPMTTYAVNATTTVDAKGTLGSSFSPAFTVRTPYASTLTLSPSTVTGGSSSTGTVTLDGPAGSNGMVVTLSSANSHAQVPASVTVAAGKTTATFTITTTSPATTITVKIKATATAGSAASASLTVNP